MFDNLLFQEGKLFSDIGVAYLLLINAAGLVLMAWDKIMAKMAKNRIPEKSLFIVAAIGGSIGTWLGMQFFRHKTRHAQFVYGIPLIIILQTTAVLLLHYFRN